MITSITRAHGATLITGDTSDLYHHAKNQYEVGSLIDDLASDNVGIAVETDANVPGGNFAGLCKLISACKDNVHGGTALHKGGHIQPYGCQSCAAPSACLRVRPIT